jgi:DNA-binding CsgD family transcriptional regulator/tetratricopeptide (TPR) repeat protein
MIGATVRRTTSEVLVGRAAELAEVRHVLDNAIAGHPGCLLIGGEAGVGKTTLLRALLDGADQDGLRVVRSSCVDLHGGDAPLLPIVEALRRLAADLGAEQWDAAVGDARPQLARLLPELGDTAGPDGGATALLGGVLTLVGRLAAPAPLLLAVDDVHWADPSTLDLLAFLARNLRDERILLVATFRDDEHGRGGLRHWLAEVARLPLAVRVDLGRLSREETGELLATIGGRSADAQLLERVYARSAGNPFAAEELLAAATAGPGALPPTLADLLTGRLAALGDDAHGLLRVAAAVGDRIDHPLLEAIAGLDADALTAALREAGDHRLLIGDADGDRYAFRHPLIAEAAYAELLPGERTRVHAAIAAAIAGDHRLRSGNAATVAAEIAHHWQRAGDAPQALAAAVAAGREAAHAYAPIEALELFERALGLWPEVADAPAVAGATRYDVLDAAGEAAVRCGAYERGVELLDEALADGATAARAGVLRRRRAWCLFNAGRIRDALDAYEEAASLLPPSPSAERAGVLAESALLAGIIGESALAAEAAERALTMAREVGARREEAAALNALGVALAAGGENARGIAVLREGLAMALEHGDLEDVGRAYANLTDAMRRGGLLEEAASVALAGIEHARRRGYDRGFGLFLVANAAETLLTLGRWEEADRLTTLALAGHPVGMTGEFLALLRVLLEVDRGRLDVADRMLGQASAVSGGIVGAEFVCLDAQARVALALGRDDPAAARAAWWSLTETDIAGAGDAWADVVALALRAEGALAERARARRRPADVTGAVNAAARAWRLSGRAPEQARPGSAAAAAWLTARAEQQRVDGSPDATAWAAAQAAWDAIAAAPLGAYARFRRAEALLAGGGGRDVSGALLTEAHVTCERLAAEPLRGQIEALARRARVVLAAPERAPAPPVPEAAGDLGLTARELEVLAHLVDGETNREIAEALFISVKTAGTHVTSILRKLDAHTRGEAAALAVRAELLG